MAHRSFAAQNHIQVTAIDTMVLRKGDLTSLTLNCGSQQIEDVIIIKDQQIIRSPRRLHSDVIGTTHKIGSGFTE
jgi:hypothetical protein